MRDDTIRFYVDEMDMRSRVRVFVWLFVCVCSMLYDVLYVVHGGMMCRGLECGEPGEFERQDPSARLLCVARGAKNVRFGV